MTAGFRAAAERDPVLARALARAGSFQRFRAGLRYLQGVHAATGKRAPESRKLYALWRAFLALTPEAGRMEAFARFREALTLAAREVGDTGASNPGWPLSGPQGATCPAVPLEPLQLPRVSHAPPPQPPVRMAA